MPTVRTEKINAEMQKKIYEILSTKVKDPRLTEMFTVTKVSVDKELTVAKVFVSILSTNAERANATFVAITSAANFVRSSLYKMMRIRSVPQLTFFRDEVGDYGQNIDQILNKLAAEKTSPSDKESL